jgi:cytochrome b pre-mRNA-processing protein 3
MVINLFRRRRGDQTIEALYGAIVAQARSPSFYAEHGVPDTVEGRFDMIVVHLALVIRRLRSEAEEGRTVGQAVFDAFCADMDHNLREMGFSDMAVPRRMRRFGEAFYGRASAYDRGLDEVSGNELSRALGRNIFGDEDHRGAAALAAYMRASEQELLQISGEDIVRGRVRFPDAALNAPAVESER